MRVHWTARLYSELPIDSEVCTAIGHRPAEMGLVREDIIAHLAVSSSIDPEPRVAAESKLRVLIKEAAVFSHVLVSRLLLCALARGAERGV